MFICKLNNTVQQNLFSPIEIGEKRFSSDVFKFIFPISPLSGPIILFALSEVVTLTQNLQRPPPTLPSNCNGRYSFCNTKMSGLGNLNMF